MVRSSGLPRGSDPQQDSSQRPPSAVLVLSERGSNAKDRTHHRHVVRPGQDDGEALCRQWFANLRSSRSATVEDVAKVIFAAATDGTDQLRYVATEDIKPWVKTRRETSEQEYMAVMRSQFMPPL